MTMARSRIDWMRITPRTNVSPELNSCWSPARIQDLTTNWQKMLKSKMLSSRPIPHYCTVYKKTMYDWKMPPQWSASLFYDLQLEPGNVGGCAVGWGVGGWGTCFKYLFASPGPEICKWQSGSSINTSTRLHNFLCAFSNKVTLTILILKERRNLEITMVGVWLRLRTQSA